MSPSLRHALAPAMFGTVPPPLLGYCRDLLISLPKKMRGDFQIQDLVPFALI